MPAEWEPQSATWLAWPHNTDTWPHNLVAAQSEFCQLAKTIAECQPVHIVGKEKLLTPTGKALIDSHNIHWFEIPTNDSWVRDYGPTFVHRQLATSEGLSHGPISIVGIDWRYNGWGEKYPPFDIDQAAAQKIINSLGIGYVSSKLCVEGGALDVDGKGRLLTTESCLLNPNRNPGWRRAEIENVLSTNLGIEHFIWLPGGDVIQGDDTDGHIDQLARFIRTDTIVIATDNTNADLERNQESLKDQAMEFGIQIVGLQLPSQRHLFGRQLPASYCNFIFTNEQLIVPQFDDPQDAAAIDTLTALSAGRDVIALPSVNLSVGLGSFHCLSQQQPSTV